MEKKISLTEEQLFNAAIAYELSGTDMSMEDFLKKVYSRYEEMNKVYKQLHRSQIRVGNKDRLGL